ncbi:MAG: peptidylprolyl isomerase [Gallionellaceae bacterium]|nr:peptidylprolyl isomerase [Gallionellaceae bacterium]
MNSTYPDLTRRLFILIAGALFALPALAAPLLLDRIVAVVNNSVITASELDRKVEQTLRQLAQRNTPLPPRTQLTKQLLERMITEKALLQAAEESNIRIDGDTLDRTLNRIAAQNNMDLASFQANLTRDGIDFEDFRQQIRNEMTIVRLREREVDNRVVVTDAEIDNYLASRKLDPRNQTEYNLAHILILAPEGASPEQLAELRGKAEKALAELKAGADFAQVSAAYSDAQNAMQGGGMGWRGEAKLPGLFVDAVKDIKVGDNTGVLRSPNGFHILRLLDKRGADATTVVLQTRARHILIKTNELVTDQDAYIRLLELHDRVANGGADFAELAKLHSGDLSAAKGGDLGWLSPGDTVPQFERAMNALKPNETSEPIKSPFGWHLIQVLERRDQDVSQERQRMDARRALRERKSEEAFEDWVRQTRDRAYVEYRLED